MLLHATIATMLYQQKGKWTRDRPLCRPAYVGI